LLTAAGISGTLSGSETNLPGLVGHLNYSGTQVTFTVVANYPDATFRDTFETAHLSDSSCVAAFAN